MDVGKRDGKRSHERNLEMRHKGDIGRTRGMDPVGCNNRSVMPWRNLLAKNCVRTPMWVNALLGANKDCVSWLRRWAKDVLYSPTIMELCWFCDGTKEKKIFTCFEKESNCERLIAGGQVNGKTKAEIACNGGNNFSATGVACEFSGLFTESR